MGYKVSHFFEPRNFLFIRSNNFLCRKWLTLISNNIQIYPKMDCYKVSRRFCSRYYNQFSVQRIHRVIGRFLWSWKCKKTRTDSIADIYFDWVFISATKLIDLTHNICLWFERSSNNWFWRFYVFEMQIFLILITWMGAAKLKKVTFFFVAHKMSKKTKTFSMKFSCLESGTVGVIRDT